MSVAEVKQGGGGGGGGGGAGSPASAGSAATAAAAGVGGADDPQDRHKVEFDVYLADDATRAGRVGGRGEHAALDASLTGQSVLYERYFLHSVIHAGAHGTVYAGYDKLLKVPVSVKVSTRAESMRGELKWLPLVAQCAHVPRIIDFGEHNNEYFIAVLQLIPGVTLRQYLTRLQRSNHSMSPVDAIDVLLDISKALRACHQKKFLHFDVHPGNVLVEYYHSSDTSRDGASGSATDTIAPSSESTHTEGHWRAWLIDFGLATPANERPHEFNRIYCPPEILSRSRHPDFGDDVFSLAAVFYEMLTLHRADLRGQFVSSPDFDLEASLESFARQDLVPEQVVLFLAKALSRDEATRFANVDEFEAALLELKAVLVELTRTSHQDLTAQNRQRSLHAAVVSLDPEATRERYDPQSAKPDPHMHTNLLHLLAKRCWVPEVDLRDAVPLDGDEPHQSEGVRRRLEIAQFLLDKGGKEWLNAPMAPTGETPLHLAVQLSDVKEDVLGPAVANASALVQFFLDNGADPTLRDARGRTALHCCFSTTLGDVLLSFDPNLLSMRDGDNHTPLVTSLLAGTRNCARFAGFLIQKHGAQLESDDDLDEVAPPADDDAEQAEAVIPIMALLELASAPSAEGSFEATKILFDLVLRHTTNHVADMRKIRHLDSSLSRYSADFETLRSKFAYRQQLLASLPRWMLRMSPRVVDLLLRNMMSRHMNLLAQYAHRLRQEHVIEDHDGAEWWRLRFQNRFMIAHEQFADALLRRFGGKSVDVGQGRTVEIPRSKAVFRMLVEEIIESSAYYDDADGFIHVGEFHSFLLRFGPFNVSVARCFASLFDVETLAIHPWFHGHLRRDERAFAREGSPGDFFVRFSGSQEDAFVLSYLSSRRPNQREQGKKERHHQKDQHVVRNVLVQNNASAAVFQSPTFSDIRAPTLVDFLGHELLKPRCVHPVPSELLESREKRHAERRQRLSSVTTTATRKQLENAFREMHEQKVLARKSMSMEQLDEAATSKLVHLTAGDAANVDDDAQVAPSSSSSSEDDDDEMKSADPDEDTDPPSSASHSSRVRLVVPGPGTPTKPRKDRTARLLERQKRRSRKRKKAKKKRKQRHTREASQHRLRIGELKHELEEQGVTTMGELEAALDDPLAGARGRSDSNYAAIFADPAGQEETGTDTLSASNFLPLVWQDSDESRLAHEPPIRQDESLHPSPEEQPLATFLERLFFIQELRFKGDLSALAVEVPLDADSKATQKSRSAVDLATRWSSLLDTLPSRHRMLHAALRAHCPAWVISDIADRCSQDELDRVSRFRGYTALQLACKTQRVALVGYLLRRGVEVRPEALHRTLTSVPTLHRSVRDADGEEVQKALHKMWDISRLLLRAVRGAAGMDEALKRSEQESINERVLSFVRTPFHASTMGVSGDRLQKHHSEAAKGDDSAGLQSQTPLQHLLALVSDSRVFPRHTGVLRKVVFLMLRHGASPSGLTPRERQALKFALSRDLFRDAHSKRNAAGAAQSSVGKRPKENVEDRSHDALLASNELDIKYWLLVYYMDLELLDLDGLVGALFESDQSEPMEVRKQDLTYALQYVVNHGFQDAFELIRETAVAFGLPLYTAARQSEVSLLHLYLESGSKSMQFWSQLIDSGASLLATSSFDSDRRVSVLMLACRAYRLPCVRSLLEDFALNVNKQSESGSTALHYACIALREAVLADHAAANAQLLDGDVTGHRGEAIRIIQYLVRHGAKVVTQDNAQQTPLSIVLELPVEAMDADVLQVVELLVEAGAELPRGEKTNRVLDKTFSLFSETVRLHEMTIGDAAAAAATSRGAVTQSAFGKLTGRMRGASGAFRFQQPTFDKVQMQRNAKAGSLHELAMGRTTQSQSQLVSPRTEASPKRSTAQSRPSLLCCQPNSLVCRRSLSEGDFVQHAKIGPDAPYFSGKVFQKAVARKWNTDVWRAMVMRLVVFLIFLACVVLSSLVFGHGRFQTEKYFFADTLDRTFVRRNIDFVQAEEFGKSFPNLVNMNEMWQWIEGPLLDGVYDGGAFRNSTGHLEELPDGHVLLSYNRLLTPVLLRQHRVETEHCPWSRFLTQGYDDSLCFPAYGDKTRSRATISRNESAPSPAGLDEAFRYREGASGSLLGVFSSYPAGGYIIELPRGEADAREVVAALRESNWLDMASRVLTVELTLYNPEVDMLAMLRFTVEFSAAGSFVTYRDVSVFSNLGELMLSSPLLVLLEVVILVWVLFYIWVEVQEFMVEDRYTRCPMWPNLVISDYWRSPFNYIDWTLSLLLVTSFGVRIRLLGMLNAVSDELDGSSVDTTSGFDADFRELRDVLTAEKYLTGIIFFILCMKTVQYLRLWKDVSLFVLMFNAMITEYLRFLAFLAVIIAGFAATFEIVFGSASDAYRNYGYSLFTGIEFILRGADNGVPVDNEYRVIGRVFIAVFAVLLAVLVVNLLIAILNDAYGEVQEKVGASRWCYEQYRMIEQYSHLFSDDVGGVDDDAREDVRGTSSAESSKKARLGAIQEEEEEEVDEDEDGVVVAVDAGVDGEEHVVVSFRRVRTASLRPA